MKRPASGKYDRRITFLRASDVDDGLTVKQVFAPISPAYWAHKREFSTNEAQREGQVQAVIVTKFTVRSDNLTRTIDPNDRILYNGRTYDITGAMEVSGERLAEIEISAVARADL